MLADTLRRAQAQPKPTSAKTAVLICPPLEKWRFIAFQWLPAGLLAMCGLQSDFAKKVLAKFENNYAQYDKAVGYAVRQEVEALRHTPAAVFRNAPFRMFQRIVLSAAYDVIFLIAHHSEDDAIEFADGGTKWKIVKELILQANETYHPALIFMICEARDWMEELKVSENVGSMAAASWRMPFLSSLNFTRLWIEELTGHSTLLEAQDRAFRKTVAQE